MRQNLLFVVLLSIVFFNHGISLQAQGIDNNSKADAIEDFETGDFSQYEWTFAGTADWTVTDAEFYEGVYSAKSGLITHGQTTELELIYEVYAEDTLSFWYKVSSESNYDYLRFYVDGGEQGEWAGEIGWTKAEYVIGVGTHTFTWAYEKDFSVSTGQDATWVDYITFPPMEISSGVGSDTTVICENDIVYYEDASIGPVTSWSWYFEGGIPETATVQNPIVAYTNPGSFDVSLEVTDGIESSFILMEDYMTVGTTPSSPNMPSGIALLCASWGNSTYSVTTMPGISTYNWTIEPSSAGTISGNGATNVTVVWTPDFLGTAQLRVGGVNYCGVGNLSAPLNITRYLPEVGLWLVPYVGLPDPPFELTGGQPEGGEYSGPGVSNGMFDPAEAGLGEHTITYTFTDPNFCTNTADDIITVTPYTGIQTNFDKEGIFIYPNPTSGNFTLRLNIGSHNNVSIEVFDALNKKIYSEQNNSLKNGNEIDFNFENYVEGLYYIRVTSNEFNYIEKLIIRK